MFELQLQWAVIFSEIIKRPYISVGFIALFILTLLTVTSTKSIQRRLGRTWQKIHNWVYLAGLLSALHYMWSVKSVSIQPIVYVLILLVLLGIRQSKLLKPLNAKLRKKPKT